MIEWIASGRHLEGGGDWLAVRDGHAIATLCVTYDINDAPRAVLDVYGGEPYRLRLSTINESVEAQCREWAMEKLLTPGEKSAILAISP
jgi:hypothetical protein